MPENQGQLIEEAKKIALETAVVVCTAEYGLEILEGKQVVDLAKEIYEWLVTPATNPKA